MNKKISLERFLVHIMNFLLCCCRFRLLRFLNGKEKLKLWRQFILGIKSIGKVNSADSTICVNLNSKGFYVVGSVSAAGKVGEIELNLIPAFLKFQQNLKTF
jgi:hypothetical protein